MGTPVATDSTKLGHWREGLVLEVTKEDKESETTVFTLRRKWLPSDLERLNPKPASPRVISTLRGYTVDVGRMSVRAIATHASDHIEIVAQIMENVHKILPQAVQHKRALRESVVESHQPRHSLLTAAVHVP